MAAGPSGAERDGRPGGTAPVPGPGSPVVPLERRGQGSPQGEAGPGGAVPPQLPATPGPGPAPPRCWWVRPQAGPFPKLPAAIFGNRAVRQIGGRFLATLVASFIFFLEGGDVFYLKFSFRILNGMRLKVGFGEASVNECRAGSCLLLYVVRNSGTQGLGASRACRSI